MNEKYTEFKINILIIKSTYNNNKGDRKVDICKSVGLASITELIKIVYILKMINFVFYFVRNLMGKGGGRNGFTEFPNRKVMRGF